ncbi:MAG: hypothetical protein RLO81_14145 [Fulvivirga sp.]|uniref:hypothetical protein n=1 Tax=Fulvivirga sp. TaxID=1931237 RepID=UPI0032ED6550
MITRSSIFNSILLLILSSLTVTAQKPNFSKWELENSVDEIKIFTKDSTGSLKKFGAEFVVNASSEQVKIFLRKVKDYENWIDGINSCDLVSKLSEDAYSYHFYINRKIFFGLYEIKKDGVVNSTVTQKPDFVYVESNIDRAAAKVEDYDRISHYQVKWYVLPIDESRSKIIYEGVVDVQLNFAYSIIKPAILENLEGTFKNMRAGLKEMRRSTASLKSE